MRYISAPQRSHFIASSDARDALVLSAETIGLMTRRGDDGGGEFFGSGESTPAL
jgi:hypothetical protein